MIKLYDGKRTIRFTGDLLAESSSYNNESNRWIEFKLYKTKAGQYVLWRTGKSRVVHTVWCNNNLDAIPGYAVQKDIFIPCNKCKPSFDEEYLCPELPRNKIITTKSPNSVVKLLYMTDENDVRYLTKVATELLDKASDNDEGINTAYKEEYID